MEKEPLWKTNERVYNEWAREYRNYILAKGMTVIIFMAVAFLLGAWIY